MPRPKLPRRERRSAMTFVRFRDDEKKEARRIALACRKQKVPGVRTVSDVLRESFLAGQERRKPVWVSYSI